MKYKWLLFDADGTLFDHGRIQSSALQKTFNQLGHSFELEQAELFAQINERIWLEFESGNITQAQLKIERFRLLFEKTNVQLNHETFSKSYLENLAQRSYLMEGAEQIVRQLSEMVGLLLITNGMKEVQRRRVSDSAVGAYFEGIVISEEVGFAKPDKRIFDSAFSRMGNPKKSEVLMIGDSLNSDIKGGNDYGIDTCWFNPSQAHCAGNVKARYEIRHLSEILRISW